MITRKCWAICVAATLCAFVFGFFQMIAGPTSMTTTVAIGGGRIQLSTSSEQSVLDVTYSNDGKACRLPLTSMQRRGLLLQVAGAEITYSLRFLEEDKTWPTADEFKEEECTSKTVFEVPGWVVLVVQETE